MSHGLPRRPSHVVSYLSDLFETGLQTLPSLKLLLAQVFLDTSRRLKFLLSFCSHWVEDLYSWCTPCTRNLYWIFLWKVTPDLEQRKRHCVRTYHQAAVVPANPCIEFALSQRLTWLRGETGNPTDPTRPACPTGELSNTLGGETFPSQPPVLQPGPNPLVHQGATLSGSTAFRRCGPPCRRLSPGTPGEEGDT